jgi:hypothetical protein
MANPTSPRGLLFCAAALALAGVAVGCKALPSKPSYAADVLPIFKAQCLRCHGDAVLPDGGIFEPDKSLLPSGQQPPASALTVYQAFLGRYDDSPECASAVDGGLGPPAGCQRGAKYWATLPAATGSSTNMLSDVIFGGAQSGFPMPPPPGRALSDWEATVVDSWTANPIP